MKQAKISEEQYIELFCKEKRIRDRMVLYVDVETHNKLKQIAYLFRKQYTSMSSLVDAIIWHHLKTNKDLLNRLSREDDERTRQFFLRGTKEFDNESD